MQNSLDSKLATSQLKVQQSYTNFDGLSKLKYKARVDSKGALEEVAKQFEALFMQMMLKSMRNTSLSDGLFESEHTKTYRDMFDKQIAIEMSESKGLGLASIISSQIKGVTTIDSSVNLNKGTESGIKLKPTIDALLKLNPGIKNQINQQISQQINYPLNTVKATKLNASLPLAVEVKTTAQTPLEFVNSIWAQVKEIASELKVSPKGILAQTILETGWGKRTAKTLAGQNANNLFGIKAGKSWKGLSVTALTQENIDNKLQPIKQNFRVYNNADESIKDYAQLIKNNPRYEKLLNSNGDLKKFIQAIDESGYATDPDYGRKLMDIINGPQFKDVMKRLIS